MNKQFIGIWIIVVLMIGITAEQGMGSSIPFTLENHHLPCPISSGGTLNKVIWSGTQFIAVGIYGTIFTSSDGINREGRISGTTQSLIGITWNGSQFVAVGNSVILTSPDGSTWTRRGNVFGKYLKSIAWSGSQFIAVGDFPILSSDGLEWTSQIPEYAKHSAVHSLSSVSWNGSMFVAVGSNGFTVSSPTGNDWTMRIYETGCNLNSITWNGRQFLAVGTPGIISTSFDGINWTPQRLPGY